MKSFCKLHPEFCTLGVKTGYNVVRITALLHCQLPPLLTQPIRPCFCTDKYAPATPISSYQNCKITPRRELFSGLLLGYFVNPTYCKDHNHHNVQDITSLPSQKLPFMLQFKNTQVDMDPSKNTDKKIFSMPNQFILIQMMTRGQP